MTAALYFRVSKRDSPQTTENQRIVLRKFAFEQEGWEIYKEYEDHDSGAKSDRPGFTELMADAKRKRFDVVVFWALDRFSREGAFKTLDYLNDLTKCGIAYCSFTEQYLDTVGVFKEAVIAILAVIAQQERIRISERIKTGLARIHEKGIHTGAQPITKRVDMEHFRRAMTVYTGPELAQVFQMSMATMYKLKKMIREEDLRRKEAETANPAKSLELQQ